MTTLNLNQLDLRQEINLIRAAMRSAKSAGAVSQLFQTLTVLQTAEAKLSQYNVLPKSTVTELAYRLINIAAEECQKRGYTLDTSSTKTKVDAAIAAARNDAEADLRVIN